MDYLEIPKLRLERATEHLNQFRAESEAFLATNPFGIEPEFSTLEGNPFVVLRFRVYRAVPKRLGVLAGDCVHNLRSTLDNVIWSLGLKHGPVDHRISFPICDSAFAYKETLKRKEYRGIGTFPDAAQTLILNLQPYHCGAPEAHPMHILRELSNADKHKTPDVMGSVNNCVDLEALGYRLGQPSTVSAGLSITDRKEFARGVVLKSWECSKKPTYEIVFGSDGPARWTNADYCLQLLLTYVRQRVLQQFESFL